MRTPEGPLGLGSQVGVPWPLEAIRPVVKLAEDQRAKATAHTRNREGAQANPPAGMDSAEHGNDLNEEPTGTMARTGTFLTPALAVFPSSRTVPRTIRERGWPRLAGKGPR